LHELSRTLPNKVYGSKISVETVKMSFVKNLTRKERQHKEALVKAEASIKVASTAIDGANNEDDGNDLLRNV
jgi:hypothetical protein